MQAIPLTTKTRRLALTATLLLLLTSGLAQTATPPATDTAKTNKEADEVPIVLSPFVVDASRDQGYEATSTLAGSRINTDLKDVSQSITIVTKAFMTDVGAVNINDILSYTAGTEGTRDYTSSHIELGKPTDSVANNSNTSNRIRGLAAPDITRDYFFSIGTWAGFDTYNLDEVTVVRGPNSVLAGIGSPAGIINYSPQLAVINRNINEVSYRIGSYGDQRATLNSNYTALKDVLAVRVAAAWSDKGFEQKPAWNRDKRFYLALTYKPWSKTTIRAAYEHVKVDAHNPNTITPEDDVTVWAQNGKPTYDSASTAPVSSLLTSNAGNSPQPLIMFNKSGAIEKAYEFNTTGYTFYYPFPSNVSLFTPLRMHDDTYFKLHEVNLNPSLQDLKQETLSFSVDQEILHGLYANVAYVKEKVDNSFLDLFRTEYAVYSIDVNKNLPGGAANPHFMETYMQFRGLDNKRLDNETNEVIRGTLTYNLDLKKYNKWLGRYQMTGFAENRKTEAHVVQYNATNTGANPAEAVGYRYYLGGSDTTPAQTVPGYPALFTGVPFNGGTLDTFYKLKGDNKNKENLRTEAAVVQAYWWDDKIVGMFGVRRDTDGRQFADPTTKLYPQPGQANYNVPFSNTTRTYGLVVHPLKWLSLHYNRSENFTPNSGAMDLLGATTPFPTGLTKDYGFSVDLLDGKLNAKVNWFETTAASAPAGNANFPLAQWTIPYLENEFMPNLAAQAGVTYQKLMSPAINQGSSYGGTVGDPRLANGYTSDNVSKGIELELTYNVTKNWRVMASVTKQEAKQANIASGLTAFIENRLAYWQSIPALWTARTYTGSGWGQGRTGQQQWQADNEGSYIAYKAAEGQPSSQLAKWHASAITNYEFSDGPVKGFSIGGGARYIEKQVIGNPVFTNPAGAVTGLDLAHPYTSGGYVAVDAWMGYKMKVFAEKYDLIFQLNIRDLQESGSFRPIAANSDGTHSTFRIVQPRTYYLTTTLKF